MIDTLDRLFSAIVRSVGSCENCGSTTGLQCAHGFSRRYRNVRWDRRNAFCLCQRCHMKYTHRPLEWDEWLRERWGPDLYVEIRSLALLVGVKVDMEQVRAEVVEEIRSRGITVNRLPKGASGWVGITDTDAA